MLMFSLKMLCLGLFVEIDDIRTFIKNMKRQTKMHLDIRIYLLNQTAECCC